MDKKAIWESFAGFTDHQFGCDTIWDANSKVKPKLCSCGYEKSMNDFQGMLEELDNERKRIQEGIEKSKEKFEQDRRELMRETANHKREVERLQGLMNYSAYQKLEEELNDKEEELREIVEERDSLDSYYYEHANQIEEFKIHIKELEEQIMDLKSHLFIKHQCLPNCHLDFDKDRMRYDLKSPL